MTTLHPGAVFGHYRLDRILGEGGMGVVYDAFDTKLERQVALKMVHAHLADRQFIDMFIREGQTLAQIRSPHIIAIYDIGEQQGSPFIVTQFIKGGDVSDLVRSKGPLAPHLACLVNAQVAEALHDAHQAGIIHQDVKPSNVLVRNPGSPLDPFAFLCDFGIATSSSDSPAGGITGTWNYLAPEYIRDERDAQGRPIQPAPSRDIYAAGCMLWFTLTGKIPYSGEAVQVAMAHQSAPIPQFVGSDAWTKEANRILQLSLAKDPKSRYQSAAVFKDDLLKLREITSPPQLQPAPSMTDPNPLPILVAAIRPPTEAEAILIEEQARPSKITPLRVTAAMLGVAALGVGGALAITQPWVEDGPEPIVPTVKGAAYADVNGDKFGDVVTDIPNKDGNGVDVITWTSDGRGLTPSKPVNVDSPQLTPEAPALDVFPLVGDFQGNDKNSMLTLARDADGMKLSGTFEGHVDAPSLKDLNAKMKGSDFYYDMGVEDFDGDGSDDLYMSVDYGDPDPERSDLGFLAGEGRIYFYRNNGSGFEAPELFVKYSNKDRQRAVIGDFNGDHKADMVLMNRNGLRPATSRKQEITSTLRIYVGNGTSGDLMAKEFPFTRGFNQFLVENGSGQANAFLAGDVNGDGRDELVLQGIGGTAGTDIVIVTWTEDLSSFKQALRGHLPSPSDLFDHPTSFDATLADLNGDGLTDVVGVTRDKSTEPYKFYGAFAGKDGNFTVRTLATWKQSPDDVDRHNLMGGTIG
ncbi:protein kinase [Nocardioides sp. CCNWLW239]|uniref:protein kinase domain-containing protein n=1 Tax=Nocardioides sp. CCNWLW239 TaxID=3128902 RepID=UPI003018185D